MKEYSLLERLILILKVVISIISWVSRIVFKIARGAVPGGTSSVAGTPAGGGGSSIGNSSQP